MEVFCNGTQRNDWGPYPNRLLLFGVMGAMLAVSLSVNIFCCVSKCCSGKGTRRRKSQRRMEENPIYGNVNYLQTNVPPFTDSDPPQSPESSNSQTNPQDCYANLSLKPPRPQSARSAPQTQVYSGTDRSEAEVAPEPEKGDEVNTETMSDLYASVQTQRCKAIVSADTGEDYANHL